MCKFKTIRPNFLLIFIILFSPSFAQVDQKVLKFTGADIQMDKIKVFQIIDKYRLIEDDEPKVLESSKVIYTYNVDEKKINENSKIPPNTQNRNQLNQEVLSDTILLFNVDSLGVVKLNSLRGVFYQYNDGCIVRVNNFENKSKPRADTIFIELQVNNKFSMNNISLYKYEIQGTDLYHQKYPDIVCHNNKIFKRDMVLREEGNVLKYNMIDGLTYSDSTLDFYEKIKSDNWFSYDDTLGGVKKYIYYGYTSDYLDYPEKAEQYQIEGYVAFKFLFGFDHEIKDIQLVYGEDPILVVETAKFINKFYYLYRDHCFIHKEFKYYFDKIPETFNIAAYLVVKYSILKSKY